MQHPGKRHKTGFTVTPLHLAAGGLLHPLFAPRLCAQPTFSIQQHVVLSYIV